MNFVKLDQNYHDQLLKLEGQMYWNSGKWKDLWDKEARGKFDSLINDYLTNYPKGCFGLLENDELVGSIFLLKVKEIKPIPYVNRVPDFLDENGDIAYVSFFVVRKGTGDKEIAKKLYLKAKDVAQVIGCKKIAVVINNSPLEENILKENNYQKLPEQFMWEIYPGMTVPCYIYCLSLSN
jgi:hypothetical protein